MNNLGKLKKVPVREIWPNEATGFKPWLASNKEKNKNLFDALKQRKDQITSGLGSQLRWERQDDKRASRIVIYREGNIESSESELEKIRKWHIEKLLELKEIFEPELKTIIKESKDG